ncbi:MAG: hypothetical protein U5J99_04120 [Parvularculaceae bacterium]|nr:hypothetical protein [Parvularculaceae bacterium]
MKLQFFLALLSMSSIAACANAGSTASGGASAFDRKLLGPEVAVEGDALRLVYVFLSYQCGAETTDNDFGLAAARLPREAEAILLRVVQDGPPPEARAISQQQAEARYQRRQSWLAENGANFFGDTASDPRSRNRNDYIAEALRSLDSQYRENALWTLGFVAQPSAEPVIAAEAVKQPRLRAAAEAAIKRIRARSE